MRYFLPFGGLSIRPMHDHSRHAFYCSESKVQARVFGGEVAAAGVRFADEVATVGEFDGDAGAGLEVLECDLERVTG